MERQQTIGYGALFLIVVAVATFWARIEPPKAVAPAAAASSSANVVPPPTPSAIATLEAAVESALSPDQSGGEDFERLLDGRKAPPLPATAPQQVTFGVVVVSYQGAQFAGPNARTKEQAKQRALSVIGEAKSDFSAVVAKGDRGSTSNAGRMPRGILEAAPEYVLFALAKGEVASEPVDTPRGYWILRRIE